jgi:hypothetical protein
MLGVADSSVIPTFGSLDNLSAILAARSHELWPYYAAVSCRGRSAVATVQNLLQRTKVESTGD